MFVQHRLVLLDDLNDGLVSHQFKEIMSRVQSGKGSTCTMETPVFVLGNHNLVPSGDKGVELPKKWGCFDV